MLQSSFHIGDELVSINDVPVTSAKSAARMLKSCADKIAAQLTLRRLPSGFVCLVRRNDSRFESLGIRTVGGTAEVSFLASANGIANFTYVNTVAHEIL